MRKHFYLKNNSVNLELYPGNDSFSLRIEFQNDFENTIMFNLSLPFLFKFYVSLDTKLCKTKWWQKLLLLDEEHKYEGRSFAIAVNPDEVAWGKDYYLQLQLGEYPWSSGGGYSFFKSMTDLIYGNMSYSQETLDKWNRSVFIPGVAGYSDGTYDLVIRKQLSKRVWKRFNKKQSEVYFTIDCEKGVPDRFKYGSQDRVFSSSFSASCLNEAIEKFIADIQESRTKV